MAFSASRKSLKSGEVSSFLLRDAGGLPQELHAFRGDLTYHAHGQTWTGKRPAPKELLGKA